MGSKRSLGRVEGGVAHSEVQRRRNKLVSKGALLFEEEKGEMDKRLDLGLQDAPRSTTYTRDQTNAQKGRTVR